MADKRKNNSAPTKMTKEVLQKLEAGFTNSLTDEECCLYANINPSTLYRYIEKNPKFGERKELLKKKPNIQAKVNWIKKINASDYQASKEWLERKSRDEFSLKTVVDENINGELILTTKEVDKKPLEELKDGIQALLNK